MSSTFIYDRQAELVSWAEAQIPNQNFRNDARAIGHERGGRIVGVVVFDTFSPRSCMVSLASDGERRWMTRGFAVRAMAYPFIQCGFARISCLVSVLNVDSLRYTLHFGWKFEGLLREEGPLGEDVAVFGMLRRECRWLPIAPALA